MKTTIQLFYTAPFTPAARSQLEYILSAASEYQHLQYEPIYDPAFDALSAADLFKRYNFALPHGYALVADNRTLTELHSNVSPTVLVVSPWSTTPELEWQLYTGPGDLSLLTPYVRLAILRALAEERATLDLHKEEWFWADPRGRQFTDKLWLIQTLRADSAGAAYACAVYGVKDVKEMHALCSSTAARTGGVFHGLH